METAARIKNSIMIRVYGIWLLKRVLPIVIFEGLLLLIAARLFGDDVFVAAVVESLGNALKVGSWNVVSFVVSTLINSRFVVKMEILTGLLMIVFLIWSVGKAVVSYNLIRRNQSSEL